MKRRLFNKLYEAKRILRTIDPKIWASMSSSSSVNKATKAANVKPRSTDTLNILLLKYVAGLLTIKAPCPMSIDDITTNVSYQNIGNKYINDGGTLEEIQKLYVENGGVLPENTDNDYPSYDEVDIDTPEEIDSQNVNHNDYPSYDEVDTEENNSDNIDNFNDDELLDDELLDDEDDDLFMDFDNINRLNKKNRVNKGITHIDRLRKEQDNVSNIFGFEDPYKTLPFGKPQDDERVFVKKTIPRQLQFSDLNINQEYPFEEKVDNETKLKVYFNGLGSNRFRGILPGLSLVFDDIYGLIQSNNKADAIMTCVCKKGVMVDNNARFMYNTNELIEIGTPGNNLIYDDYYYNFEIADNKMFIGPGSAYYGLEESNGLKYTKTLATIGNKPAEYILNIELSGLDNIQLENNITEKEFKDGFKQMLYIPTLPELAKCSKYLKRGRYWTSSVGEKGTGTLVLELNYRKDSRGNIINTSKVLVTTSPNDRAILVLFAKF